VDNQVVVKRRLLLPDKQLHLPQVSVMLKIAQAGDGFDVKSVTAFARDVYVSLAMRMSGFQITICLLSMNR